MAKSKRRSRRRAEMTVAVTIAAPMLAIGANFARDYKAGGLEDASRWLAYKLTGYDIITKHFDTNALKSGALPLAVGAIAHQAANRLGINRAIANMKLPIIRI